MPKTLIALRLPADVLKNVDDLAAEDSRTRSAMIELLLRKAIDKEQKVLAKEVIQKSADIVSKGDSTAAERILQGWGYPEAPHPEADSQGRYRKCPHGRNEWTCSATRCKISTNR